MISGELYEASFLDLFSGSGAIGIEALSRGAVGAVFVDDSLKSIDVIKGNLSKARLSDKAEVIKGNVLTTIASLGARGKRFDIIFMDPPYDKGLVEASLSAIVRADVLNDNGFIIAEQAADEKELAIDGLTVERIKHFGRTTKMTFLAKKL
jgi:16S rRNA (guanine(966)-N(2))-methyltransferase RsmD